MTPTEWAYILETEGAAVQSEYGYAVEAVEVECYDGRRLPAFTLMAQPKTVAQLQVRGWMEMGGVVWGGQAGCI